MVVLRHSVSTRISRESRYCIDVFVRPEVVFDGIPFVDSVEAVNGVYNIRFKWRKFGRTFLFKVRLIVERNGDSVRYVSTADSDYNFILNLQAANGAASLGVEMKVGLVAGIALKTAMRRDFKMFTETIAANIAKICGTQVKAHCSLCLLYNPEEQTCHYLGLKVVNPKAPPCKGRGFIEAPARQAAQ